MPTKRWAVQGLRSSLIHTEHKSPRKSLKLVSFEGAEVLDVDVGNSSKIFVCERIGN